MALMYVFIGFFVTLLTIISFSIGFKFGYKSAKGIQPKFEPIKEIKHAIEEKNNVQKDKQTENYIKNIFNYDGEVKG